MNLTPFTRPRGRHILDTQQASDMRKMCRNPPSINDSSWATRVSNDPDSLTSLDVRGSASSTPMTNMAILLLASTLVLVLDSPFIRMDIVSVVNCLAIVALAIALRSDTRNLASSLGAWIGTLSRSLAFVTISFSSTTCSYAGSPQDKVVRITWTTELPKPETNNFLHVVSGVLDRLEISIAHLSLSRLATTPDMHMMHKALVTLIRSSFQEKPYVQYICKHQEIPRFTLGGADTMEYLNIVLDYNRRDAMPKDNTVSSCLTNHTMMRTLNAFRGYESGQGTKIRYIYGHLAIAFATVFGLPLAAAAFTILPAFRIIAGIGASTAAVAVIPLRTIPEITNEVWISAYAVWAIFFSAYLVMQVLLIPSEMSSRRKLFISCVIIAAVHFSIGLAQTSTTLADAFTIFGPLVATLCTYVVSLMFSTGEINSNNAYAHSQGIELVQSALSV